MQFCLLAALGLALGATALFAAEEYGPIEIEGGGAKLEEWLYQQRAYPAETIPVGAGERMLEQLEKIEADTPPLLYATAAGEQALVWAPIGPQPILNGQTFGSPRNSVSGRISALTLDPRYDGVNNRTVYLGGAQGGVWKSTDNGANWAPITDDQPSQAVGAIAVDPLSPETVYVGLGEGSRCSLCYYGAGLLKSTNGGATWNLITGPISALAPNVPAFSNAAFTKLAIDPQTPSTVYATTTFGSTAHSTSRSQQLALGQVGLWKSIDGGANWTNLDPGNTGGRFSAHDIAIDPQNPNRVYAGMRTIGIFRSEANGAPGTWQRLAGGLPDLGPDPASLTQSTSPYRRVALALGPPIAPSTATTIYAAFANGSDNLLGIYRSVDNGDSWTATTIPQQQGQANYNLDIAVDPSDGNVIYYGTSANSSNNGGTFWRSRDGGQTWQDISIAQSGGGGLHADTHRIAIGQVPPYTLFTGNDGGLWRTDNAKSDLIAWKQLNDTLSLTQFVSLAIHPTNPNLVIGGTQDNGTNLYRGNLAWDHVADGDGGYALIDQSDPRVVYHTFFNQNNAGGERAQIGPRVSTSNGLFGTWLSRGCFSCSTQQGNFNPADRVAFYAPMGQNTGFTGANGNVVYFGTYRLYRTANRGLTWTGLGTSVDGFGQDLTKGTGVITAIAANPLLDNSTSPPGEVVWVGTSDGNIQVTTNAGALASATFANVTKAPLPNRFVSDISVDPNNRQHAVVVYSGFEANTPSMPGHVFLTTNQGQSWVNISGNLPDVPVTSVAVNPNSTNIIYIGTDLGVFQTTNGGATWERLGTGMPRVATFMVRYQAATNTLFAATHGRGMYRLTTAGSVATVSAADYSPTAIAPEAIVSAFGTNMASAAESAAVVPLPTTLGGTRVIVRDSAGVERLSPLFYVSAEQINYQIPPGTLTGSATVTVTTAAGAALIGNVEMQIVAPSLFTANATGRDAAAGFALRFDANNASTSLPINVYDSTLKKFVTTPLDLGASSDRTYVVLFGTGIRFRSSLANVGATIGGEPAAVEYAGIQPDYVGLDQINILVPRSLIGRGQVEIVLTADGRKSGPVTISVK